MAEMQSSRGASWTAAFLTMPHSTHVSHTLLFHTLPLGLFLANLTMGFSWLAVCVLWSHEAPCISGCPFPSDLGCVDPCFSVRFSCPFASLLSWTPVRTVLGWCHRTLPTVLRSAGSSGRASATPLQSGPSTFACHSHSCVRL